MARTASHRGRERAKVLTSPPSRLFVLFHPSKPHHPTQKKEHSLLVLPSVNAILNFATKFFEMLTKKQSRHPQIVFQVLQVFRVFQVFHFAFGPQKSPVLVQIRTKPEKSVPSHLCHLMVAENTQKSNPPTCLRTQSCPASYRRCFFSEADFCSGYEGQTCHRRWRIVDNMQARRSRSAAWRKQQPEH